jgi:hypothetical protein
MGVYAGLFSWRSILCLAFRRFQPINISLAIFAVRLAMMSAQPTGPLPQTQRRRSWMKFNATSSLLRWDLAYVTSVSRRLRPERRLAQLGSARTAVTLTLPKRQVHAAATRAFTSGSLRTHPLPQPPRKPRIAQLRQPLPPHLLPLLLLLRPQHPLPLLLLRLRRRKLTQRSRPAAPPTWLKLRAVVPAWSGSTPPRMSITVLARATTARPKKGNI